MISGDQKLKLIQLFNEAITIYSEMETLNGGLNDTIKAVAEELEIKPSLLKKALKIAQKASFTQTTQDNETIQDILETVGKTL
jgi:hypothetical protein